MSLFDRFGIRLSVCILVLLASANIYEYTIQIYMSSSWTYTENLFHESINGIIGSVGHQLAPLSSFQENNTALLEEQFVQFRKHELELNMHSADNSFSSCLIIMDENHRLPEWLSYHMYALPLRHLVVSNDPRSKTDPNVIFDKFRRLGIKIEVWNDSDFGYHRDWQAAEQQGDIDELTRIYEGRQKFFYEQCSKYLKTQNRSWTTFHDVDEYIVLDKHYINNTETLLQQPGSILQWLQEARHSKPVGVPQQYWTKDCISLSRTMYGTHSSNITEIEKDVPEFLNASKFETLAYRHHEPHRGGGINGACKSLVDVQKVGTNTRFGIHVVMGRDHCGDMFVSSGPLAINHYVGSWEYFSYKNDSRGLRRDIWELKAAPGKIRNDDEIRPWIGGFVDHVGKHLASYLLADVGYLAPLHTGDMENAQQK